MWNYVFSHIPSAQPPLTMQRPQPAISRKYTPEAENCQTTVLLLCLGNIWDNLLDLLQHFNHREYFSPHCEKFQPLHEAPFPFLSAQCHSKSSPGWQQVTEMLRANLSPALPHCLSIRTVLQAGIPGLLQHQHCRAHTARGASAPCQAQTRRMQLSRVKPEDPDTINTPRARRSLPGQPRRTLFSSCTLQKTNSSSHWNRHQQIRKL